MFVTQINADNNQITLGKQEDLFQSDFWASKVNFTGTDLPQGPLNVTAKIRYKATEAPATLEYGNGVAQIHFEEPQRAITPGQAVVFYQGEEVLGGGIIELKNPIRSPEKPVAQR